MNHIVTFHLKFHLLRQVFSWNPASYSRRRGRQGDCILIPQVGYSQLVSPMGGLLFLFCHGSLLGEEGGLLLHHFILFPYPKSGLAQGEGLEFIIILHAQASVKGTVKGTGP